MTFACLAPGDETQSAGGCWGVWVAVREGGGRHIVFWVHHCTAASAALSSLLDCLLTCAGVGGGGGG